MHPKLILMDFCFVSSLQIDSIFVALDFTAIQRGVKFLLPVTVYKCNYYVLLNCSPLRIFWKCMLYFVCPYVLYQPWLWKKKLKSSHDLHTAVIELISLLMEYTLDAFLYFFCFLCISKYLTSSYNSQSEPFKVLYNGNLTLCFDVTF